MQCKDDVNLLRENETGITIRFQSLFISLSLEYIYILGKMKKQQHAFYKNSSSIWFPLIKKTKKKRKNDILPLFTRRQ